MKYLLDTCVWIRLLDAPENLSSDAQKILVDIESADNCQNKLRGQEA